MFKSILACVAAGVALTSIGLVEAAASDRYRQRPPVIVDNSLTAPWINQLGARRQQVRVPISGGSVTRTQRPIAQRPIASRKQQSGYVVNNRRIVRYAQPQVQPVAVKRKSKQSNTRQMDPRFLPQVVDYPTKEKAGSVIIDTNERYLYLVMGNGKARRYGVGVGKPGFEWAGVHKVSAKKQWPSWTPPKEMIEREAAKGHYLPDYMEGGPANPLGARALYLGSTLYRIHGTNAPWTIGYAVSSGCIRMRNEDVVDLYDRVKMGARVTVI